MKKNHPIFGLFFAIIIFSIPIFNQLHYSLIDHSGSINNQNKEVIHHQCQHFTFYNVFLDTSDEIEIEFWKEINDNQEISSEFVEKIYVSAIEFSDDRGPPICSYRKSFFEI